MKTRFDFSEKACSCYTRVIFREVGNISVKGKLGVLISVCIVVASALFWYVQKEPFSTETVMYSLWDEYDVQLA